MSNEIRNNPWYKIPLSDSAYNENQEFEKIWNKIEKKKKRRILIIPIFLIIGLAGSGLYWFNFKNEYNIQFINTANSLSNYSKFNQEKVNILEAKCSSNANSDVEIPSVHINKVQLNSNQHSSLNKFTSNNMIANLVENNTSIYSYQNKIRYNKQIKEINLQPSTTNSEETESSIAFSINKNQQKELYLLEVLPEVNLVPIHFTQIMANTLKLGINDSKQKLKLDYQLQFLVGRNFRSYNNFENNSAISIKNSFEKELESIGFDLLVSYKLNSNLILTSGLRTGMNTTRTNVQIKRDVTKLDTGFIFKIEEYETGQIKSYTSSRDFIIHEDLKANYYNRYYNIGIPIWIGYSKRISNNYTLNIHSGITYRLFNYSQGYSIDPEAIELISPIQSNIKNQYQFDLRLAAQYLWKPENIIQPGIIFTHAKNLLNMNNKAYFERINSIQFFINYKF